MHGFLRKEWSVEHQWLSNKQSRSRDTRVVTITRHVEGGLHGPEQETFRNHPKRTGSCSKISESTDNLAEQEGQRDIRLMFPDCRSLIVFPDFPRNIDKDNFILKGKGVT